MMKYLLGNRLISDKQYGFISGRSTSLQLLHMLDKWTDYLEYGGQIDLIDVLYSDFEKAFDKVPHSRLISKLYSLRLRLFSCCCRELIVSCATDEMSICAMHYYCAMHTFNLSPGLAYMYMHRDSLGSASFSINRTV